MTSSEKIPKDDLTSPVNVTELLEIMDNDMELLKDCFDDFKIDSVEQLQAVKNSINLNDAENLKKNAHKIKGTLKYLAADDAAKLAFKLEIMSENNQVSSAMDVFQQLANECKKIIKYAEKF